MKKEEDLPSSQQLSEVNDALINERPSEEPSFNDGRVDVYLNVRLNTNKFVINCKDDEEEREKPFPSENKEDFTVSFSTTRQRCLIPTSGEGKRYAFHCRSTDDVPKFILTNLPPCCISVKDKCPCFNFNSSSKAYYMTASDDGLLCLKEGTPPESSRTACWQVLNAGQSSDQSSVDCYICCHNQNNDIRYITVDGSGQKLNRQANRLKLTVDGKKDADSLFRQCKASKTGSHFKYKIVSHDLWIGLGEKQHDDNYPLVLSDDAICFMKTACNYASEISGVHLTCNISHGRTICLEEYAMEKCSTDISSTEDGKSGPPSNPRQDIQQPGGLISCTTDDDAI
jgi:hypothetical protein